MNLNFVCENLGQQNPNPCSYENLLNLGTDVYA